ncbi:DNA polymerase III subunit delta' [Anaerobacillus sp. MEB173]|uniref:DNA polymerase III subunit delta' n=1 Tax=Anaerobacillus sp. MEB173 TaxID=3383345 RepID=UPI003F8E702E
MNWTQLETKQRKIVKILKNGIEKDRLSHAYLFEGSMGTGKKAIAIQLAKSFFCKERSKFEPCGDCVDCKRIDSGNHPDVHIISPEGQSIKIDQIRHIQKEFSYRGVESRNKKAYIIEHADSMTVQAANSLLKFLEEPDGKTIAILLTEQAQRMLKTILSRCQVLSFVPLTTKDIADQLVSDGISAPLARLVAEITTDLETAREICSDDWFAQARNIVIQLAEEVKSRPHQVLLSLQDQWLVHFKEKKQLDLGLDLLLLWYRDVLFSHLEDNDQLVYIDQKDKLESHALYSSQRMVSEQMMAILEAKRRLSANVNPQLLMEQLLLRLQEG